MTDKEIILENLKRHLQKQLNNQSMNEDFEAGFKYAIFELEKFKKGL